MSLVSQVIGLAFNLISIPFSIPDSGDARSNLSFFPFDQLRNMREPCSSFVFQMGENELKFEALPRGFCSNCCPVKVQRDVRFVLYTKTNPVEGSAIERLKPGAASAAGVDGTLPTVVFVHGFTENSPGQSGRTIIDAYMSRVEDFNVILLDWSELAVFPWYKTAVRNVKHVGQRLQQFIEVFNDSGEIPISKLHLIGFSLGSHVVGIAGKLLRRDLRIPRITGLDPALPEYSMNDTTKRLIHTDAEYVDVIHTDAGIFGFPIAVGHADFFPNGGRALQPGCQPSYLARQRIINQVFACSHVRAWRLWAESVREDKAFPATSCSIWRGPNKECNFTTDAYMGFANTRNARGAYFLITHQDKPFGVRNSHRRTDLQ